MLHVIYRSYGGENRKGRPDWYSKELGLLSLLRAVEALHEDVDLLFVNDGPIPSGRLALMRRAGGELLGIDAGSNRGSYRWALDLPRSRRWAPSDLVLLMEDDYLLRPDALRELLDAARRDTTVDYFAIYLDPTGVDGQRVPVTGRTEVGAPPAAGWTRVSSTTSTFAVRVGALHEDRFRLRLAPFTGGAWDHTTCMLVQGRAPFEVQELLRQQPAPAGTALVRRGLRLVALTAVRLAAQAGARRRASRARTMHGPTVSVATHMEAGLLAVGTDWAALAAETEQWRRAHESRAEAPSA